MTKNKYKNVRKSNVCPITDKTDRFFCEFLSIFLGLTLATKIQKQMVKQMNKDINHNCFLAS